MNVSNSEAAVSSPAEIEREFLEARSIDLGIAVDLLDRPGTTIAPDDERSGSKRVACYQIGQHAVLACDPAIVSDLAVLQHGETSLSDAGFRSWGTALGAEIIGDAVMRTQKAALPSLDVPGTVHMLDWSRPADVERMLTFVDAADADDLDEAEVAMDDLDDQAVALLGADGAIMAYASSRAYEEAPAFGDIGVLVSADARRGGWGRAVVATLITDVLEPAGVIPLYRCSTENLGSFGLSSALGFESVLSLSMVQLPEA